MSNGAELSTDLERPLNPDELVPTERTITIEADGEHVNIPTIVGGLERSPEEAIALWERGDNPETGRFASLEEAEAAAQTRSDSIGELLAAEDRGAAAPAPAAPAAPAAAPAMGPYQTAPGTVAPSDQGGFLAWARATGQLPLPRAAAQPRGRAAAAKAPPPPEPISWADRRQQSDYMTGSIETRQKIQEGWYREWEGWSEKYFPKKADQRAFKDKLYELNPREKMPDRTWTEALQEFGGRIAGGTLGVVRGVGWLGEITGAFKPSENENNLSYVFSSKFKNESDKAFYSTAASERTREQGKIEDERQRVAMLGKSGFWEKAGAGAAAQAKFYSDYPDAVGWDLISQIPIYAASTLIRIGAGGLAMLGVGRGVASGALSPAAAQKIVQGSAYTAQAVGYGAQFGAETYDNIVGALKALPPERWATDPIYVEARAAQPNKTHDEVVDMVARERAFWPSMLGGAVGGVIGPLGFESLVGVGSKAMQQTIAATAAQQIASGVKRVGAAAGKAAIDPLTEAGEGIYQAAMENRAVAEVAPELEQPGKIGQAAVQGAAVALGPGLVTGAASLRRLQPQGEGAQPGAAPGPPGGPGATPGAGQPPVAGAPAPAAGAQGAAPAADLGGRIVQATAKVGEEAFQKGLDERIAALPADVTPEQQEAALSGYVDEILGAVAPTPPGGPPPGGPGGGGGGPVSPRAAELERKFATSERARLRIGAEPGPPGAERLRIVDDIKKERERLGLPITEPLFPGDPTAQPGATDLDFTKPGAIPPVAPRPESPRGKGEFYTISDLIGGDGRPERLQVVRRGDVVQAVDPQGNVGSDLGPMLKAGFSIERAIAQVYGEDTSGKNVAKLEEEAAAAPPSPAGPAKAAPAAPSPAKAAPAEAIPAEREALEKSVEAFFFRLPKELDKISPRYAYKDRNFEVQFENDFDRATYTLAQPVKNKRHDAILNELLDTGYTEQQLIDHGKRVRARLKEWAQGAPAETTRIRLPAVAPPVRLAPAARAAAETETFEKRQERSRAAAERAKAQQRIDPVRDSLFTAIAKLGGINRAEVEGAWGVDPAAKVGASTILHVLRREGGRTIDDMGEALGQLGYLDLDANGKHDLRDFEEKFDLELRGERQYTPLGEEARTAADRRAEAEAQREADLVQPIAEADELSIDEVASTGYFDLNSDEQRAADALVASLRERFTGTEAEAAIDGIIERAALAAEGDADPAAFRRAIIAQLKEEVGRERPAAEPAPAEREQARPGGEEARAPPRAAPERQEPARPATAEAGAVAERAQAIREARDEMAAELEKRAQLTPPSKRNAKKRKDITDAIAEASDRAEAESGGSRPRKPRRPRAGAPAAPGAEAPERAGVELPPQVAEGEGAAGKRPSRGLKRPSRKRGGEGEEGGPARSALVEGPPIPREWVSASIAKADDSPEIERLRERLRDAMDSLEGVREQNRRDIAAAADPDAAGAQAIKKADAARVRVDAALAAVDEAVTYQRARKKLPGDNAYVKMLQERMDSALAAADTALTEFKSFSELAAKTAERTDEEVSMLQAAKEALLKDRQAMQKAARKWAEYVETAREVHKRTTNPTNESALKKAIASIFGFAPEEFERRLPKIFIASESEIHDGDKLTLRRGGKTYTMQGASPSEAAFYDWSKNIFVFFPGRINKGEEREAFLHETFHKRGEQFIGAKQMDRFRKDVEDWRNAPRGSMERAIYGAVQRRLGPATAADTDPLTKEARGAEELLPYAMSEAAARGVPLDPKAGLQKGVRGWLARIYQTLKSGFMRMFGVKPEDGANLRLTVQDLMAMAVGAAHLELDAPALEAAAAKGKPLPKGTKLPGAAAARKILEARPIFGQRVSELLSGAEVYVPEMTPEKLRRFKLRYFETPTGRAALAASKAELANAAQAPAPVGPDSPQFSPIIFGQPRKALPIRTRKDLQDFMRDGKRPETPFLPQIGESVIENLADNQRPFYRWLQEHGLGTRAWDRLKLVTGRLRERGAIYKREILDPISLDVAKLAKENKANPEQATLDVGWWATLRHVPEANRAIQMKLIRRIAAGDRTAIAALRRFTETQAGLHPSMGDDDRGAMAANVTDAEAAQYRQQIEARYSPQGRAELERIADKIVDAFARLKQDAIASGQISPAAAAQFPNFKYYVALTGDNAPVWDADEASDAFGSHIAENRLRGREGRGGDTVAESSLEALAERMGRVAAYHASVPFKREINDIYLRAGGPNNTIGLERVAANLVQSPRHSDIVWTDPAGKRYIYRFSQSESIGEALLGQNRQQADGFILKTMDFTTRAFSRAVTQWVIAFGPINMTRDVTEKSILIRSRGVVDQNGNPVDPNAVFKKTWANAVSGDTWRTAYELAFAPDHKASSATSMGRYSNELVEDGGVSTWGENTRRGLKTIKEGVDREAKLAGLRGAGFQGWENVREWIARYNLMFEIVSSLSVNAALRDLNVDRTTASAATLDLMNFSNVGAKTRWARAAYAFFNPAVQSGAQLFRMLGTRRGFRDFVTLLAVAGLVQGLMRMFGDDDPELGDELDQKGTWELDRNVPVKLLGVPLKLPVGFGAAQLAWAWMNSVGRFMSGRYNAGDAIAQAAVSFLKGFNPVPISEVPPNKQPLNFALKTVAPTAFRPLVDMATDTDAWGTKLTTYYPDRSKLRSEQGKVGTPVAYKDIARHLQSMGIDMYPEHVRGALDTVMIGPVGYAWQSWVESNKEAEGRRLNAIDKVPGSALLRITGASRLIGGTSRYLEARYYEKMDALLEDKRKLNQAKGIGREAEFRRMNPEAMRRLSMIESHEAEMRELSKEFNATVRALQTDTERFGSARIKFERIADRREKAMREFLRKTKDPMWNVDAVKGVTP